MYTIIDLLQRSLRVSPDSPAILSCSGTLSYAHLIRQIETTVRQLRAAGLERNDRIAVVLPNGPEMAVAFFAVASGCACAPLNPAYRAEEFDFYLSDLGAKALVLLHGFDNPSKDVAVKRGIRVLELLPDEGAAGGFNFADVPSTEARPEFAGAEDIALILHTSGTTSKPKMVPLNHRNLTASAEHIRNTLQLTSADRCLNVMPLFHVHGLVGALLASMAGGGSIVCTRGFEAPRFFDWFSEFRPTWYTAVPTIHQAILARARAKTELITQGCLRFIRSSSLSLPSPISREMERVFATPVIDSYGMTEASHQMTSNPLPPACRKPGSVGRASGTQVAIMDETGNLLHEDAVGEVVVRGPNVTLGYDNNPDANRLAYHDGWFRTGDQGYLDSEGYLFLTGRLKEIINRGGEKISPREIDEVLLQHPLVEEAITFALPDVRLGEDVGAAVVLRSGHRTSELELKEYAATRLADFKIPRRVLILDAIPKGPTGKPQRIGLAKRLGLVEAESSKSTNRASIAPTTETEVRLCDLWKEILRVDQVGVEDDFFQLGGDSMLATQSLARLRQRTGSELQFVVFFSEPTVAAVARWMKQGRTTTVSELRIISRRALHEEERASVTQEAMYFVHQREREKSLLNRPALFRVRGDLNFEALREAFIKIVQRHEVLRTTYRMSDGRLIPEVRPIDTLDIPLLDLTTLPVAESEIRTMEIARTEASRPFDLSQDLMLRVTVIRLKAQEHYLFLNMHHIASDGWSSVILLKELSTLYAAYTEPPFRVLWPELPIQYSDFAIWQHQLLGGSVGKAHISYWKSKLAGSPELLELSTDRPRPVLTNHKGARESIMLPAKLARSIKNLSYDEGVTLFMTTLAAFQTLLHRYTGATDLVVGSVSAGRTRLETENLIGLFINQIALRTELSGDPTFRELLKRVRSVAVEAYTHQDVPFVAVVEVLHPRRDSNITPLFQVHFQLRNLPEPATKLHDLRLEHVAVDPGVANFDLDVEVENLPQGLRCLVTYDTDLFDAGTIQRMLGHYRTILEAVVADPNQRIATLPMLTESERRTIFEDWNRTEHPWPEACFPELFETRVQRAPELPAVICEGVEISYGELNRRANQVAHRLRTLGVGTESIVGLFFERSIEMLASIVGTLKSGGTYLPLDSGYPSERLATILEDAKPAVVLCSKTLRDRLPAGNAKVLYLDSDWSDLATDCTDFLIPSGQSAQSVADANAAYVIYTSGSTGKPKGVVVTHKSLSNHIWCFNETFRIGENDRCLQVASYGFDFSIAEIFPTLASGGCLVLPKPGGERDADYLATLIAESRVTVALLVPSLLDVLIEQPDFCDCVSLRAVVVGGETLPVILERRFLERSKADLYNIYGPTETTFDATRWRCRREYEATRVPIGRPISNYQALVLDKNMQLLPVGVPGEVHIGGAGLARGYLNSPELTRAKFVPDPFSNEPGARLYKSGDVARYLPSGDLDFLGRLDRQIKLRGFRIELGELEWALCQHPDVREVVAAARRFHGFDVLVAYYVAAASANATHQELADFLGRSLPGYMIPAHFMRLEAFPLTPNGKIDVRALPEPDAASYARHSESVQLLNPAESAVAEVWYDVLGHRHISADTDFFEAGGDSLQAMRLVSRLNATIGRTVSLEEFFRNPTIAGVASEVQCQRG